MNKSLKVSYFWFPLIKTHRSTLFAPSQLRKILDAIGPDTEGVRAVGFSVIDELISNGDLLFERVVLNGVKNSKILNRNDSRRVGSCLFTLTKTKGSFYGMQQTHLITEVVLHKTIFCFSGSTKEVEVYGYLEVATRNEESNRWPSDNVVTLVGHEDSIGLPFLLTILPETREVPEGYLYKKGSRFQAHSVYSCYLRGSLNTYRGSMAKTYSANTTTLWREYPWYPSAYFAEAPVGHFSLGDPENPSDCDGDRFPSVVAFVENESKSALQFGLSFITKLT